MAPRLNAGGIAPTLGVLFTRALLETVVPHVVAAALWGWRAAIVPVRVRRRAIVAVAHKLDDPAAFAAALGRAA